jgi:hypothetical protein
MLEFANKIFFKSTPPSVYGTAMTLTQLSSVQRSVIDFVEYLREFENDLTRE